jgi:hypothetical protein
VKAKPLIVIALLGLACSVGWAGEDARVHIERLPVAGGGELLTVFADPVPESGTETAKPLPILSILRDTLGDPDSERLRKVWVLTYVRPSITQRAAAALPFFYMRVGARNVPENHPPGAILDLSAPQRQTLSGLVGAAVQSELLDPAGVYWRAPTRGYRGNAAEYRNMHIGDALEVLSRIDTDEEAALTPSEWDEITARLTLSRQLLGGFVRESHLARVSEHRAEQLQVNRGRNWEVLRQRAEADGLYFQPLAFGDRTPGYALLWISRADFERDQVHSFDGELLSISNPWTNANIRNWRGYEQTWYFDRSGNCVNALTEGGHHEQMIPLALYGLDYSPAPVLLVDFDNSWKPKRREMIRRAADYTATGVLGWTGVGHWSYMLAHASWNWLRNRHGDMANRTARLSAYAELGHLLAIDETLDPRLRQEIAKRLDHLALNPFEYASNQEVEIARKQYDALVAWARDPRGLPATLARDRGSEAVPLMHGPSTRVFFDLATVSTLGIYHHRQQVTDGTLALVERKRRIEADQRFLTKVVNSGPQIDVAWNMEEVAARVADLNQLRPVGRELEPKTSALIARVFNQTSDDSTRRLCLAFLSRMNSGDSRRELERISANTAVPSTLRGISEAYLDGLPTSNSEFVETGTAGSGAGK